MEKSFVISARAPRTPRQPSRTRRARSSHADGGTLDRWPALLSRAILLRMRMGKAIVAVVAVVGALAGCAPPGTLAQMQDEGIVVQVPLTDSDSAALRVDVQYPDV